MAPDPSAPNAPAWLTARPIAHRALHDAARGVIENTPSAVDAALARDYAIEVDIQLSADGEAVVFHDDTLERLTLAEGPAKALTAAQLKAIELRGTADRMMTLAELLARVGGRVPLIIELKSHFDGETAIAARAATVLSGYGGPAALMSFDPALVAALRSLAPHIPRGITMEHRYDDPEWDILSAGTKHDWGNLLHLPQTRPDFIAHYVKELPSAAVDLARRRAPMPLLAWTVRTPQDRAVADCHADQMIFEGFLP
ncbi:glycerophosphodiester phosphodiesterase [Ancylobacter dichloromethanicus]|uniref:Glycerophosphoryl diester phosphodiesterase n=1 Tax=Ancylobacter dichloromethanicus TaxID=518825 RepID=A0A9W6MYL2_9HYPH|nr:glycerophosphodiester phosphodiesterase family protein [Ancylobacter dichloromethanicus]MBS7554653.1 glycerophosphodiester phosphodiesterase [Ancylobacter dichloromethanicus]GLK71784.1 glycerophosphoryl diester phosphodiesterase [Ancylobacter dichloromethanicus]